MRLMDSPTGTPELEVVEWMNGSGVTLEELRGKVVLLEAFQMLCPGCVSHGLPQAQKVHQMADPDQLAVIGLHTVFEHHGAMGPESLAAFIHEYRLTFPIGIDAHEDDNPLPVTMRRYGMRGTPTTILLDRSGSIRFHQHGPVDDFVLGAQIGALLTETRPMTQLTPIHGGEGMSCEPGGECC